MNKICITGRLTDAVELKQTNSGTSVASFTIAVRRPKVKDTTDFIPCVAWRQSAEYLAKYSHKGDRIAVDGVLTVREYTDSQNQKRRVYEVLAEDTEVLESKPEAKTEEVKAEEVKAEEAEEDLPF